MEQPKTKTVVTITEMARMVSLSPARFRQLMGTTFPSPLYSVSTRRPFYTEDMQLICLDVRRRNCGIDGRPVLFYCRRGGEASVPRKPRTIKTAKDRSTQRVARRAEGSRADDGDGRSSDGCDQDPLPAKASRKWTEEGCCGPFSCT